MPFTLILKVLEEVAKSSYQSDKLQFHSSAGVRSDQSDSEGLRSDENVSIISYLHNHVDALPAAVRIRYGVHTPEA